MEKYNVAEKEKFVHEIFTSIAYRYDVINTLLSFNRDRYWRTRAVSLCQIEEGAKVLDVCCGTGMLTAELAKSAGRYGKVVGLDFCHEMLVKAREKFENSSFPSNIELIEGNAMQLPFADNTFDCAIIGFGLRNVPDIENVLGEMRRVVRSGGRVVSLDLAKPSFPVFKQLYYVYFEKCLPLLGKWGAHKDGAYGWLPRSLQLFPHQSKLCRMFSEIGLKQAAYYELTGGIVAVHVGIK